MLNQQIGLTGPWRNWCGDGEVMLIAKHQMLYLGKRALIESISPFKFQSSRLSLIYQGSVLPPNTPKKEVE